MTIDDSYFDVSSFVEGSEVEKDFDRIMRYLRDIETENEQLRITNSELTITIQTMMGIKEQKKPYRPPSSPYDLSKGDKGFKGLRR